MRWVLLKAIRIDWRQEMSGLVPSSRIEQILGVAPEHSSGHKLKLPMEQLKWRCALLGHRQLN